jgi:hypothetical protein
VVWQADSNQNHVGVTEECSVVEYNYILVLYALLNIIQII